MATLADLQTRVTARALTNDNTAATALINDVYRDIVSKAKLNPKKTTLSLTAGVDGYTLSSTITDFNGLLTIRFTGANGVVGAIEHCSLSEIERRRAASIASGIPVVYTMVGFDKLEVWPVPPTTGDTLTVWYTGAPTALASAGDIPSLVPSEYHAAIEVGAAARLAAIYETDGENRQLKADLLAEYQQLVGELRAFITRHATDQPRRLRVGYQRYPRLRPATPSTDVGGERW